MRLLFTLIIICNALIVVGQQVTVGLASPIQLQPKQTIIVKSDYFPFGTPVQKVEWPAGLILVSENPTNYILKGKLTVPLANIRFHTTKGVVDIPCRNVRKLLASARIELAAPASDVRIKGSFNAWLTDSTLLKPVGPVPTKTWQLGGVHANEGFQQYKLVVNGKEENPTNATIVSNGMGGTNALLKVGAPDAVAPSLQTLQSDKQHIFLRASNSTFYLAYLNNKLIAKEQVSLSGLIQLSIPKEAYSQNRSVIRVYVCNAFKTGNDLFIPLNRGAVIQQPDSLSRKDLHTQIMYFLMVDRFQNGDRNNDPKPLDSVLPKAQYLGGDLKGVQQKVNEDFFAQLGTNTLWLSPISQNPSGAWGFWNKQVSTKFSAYHGYWPTSYSKVDERFGSNPLFATVIKDAHSKNMNVVLDFVAHHVHTDHPLYLKHPDWATPLILPDGSMNTERWDDHRLTTWFDTFLPTLDLQRKEVREVVADSVMYWVKNFDLDGFRHDASKHVPEDFWRLLTQKIKLEKSNKVNNTFYQIGETYGSPELIGSYVNSGQMDAQFDFNLYDAAVGAFASNSSDDEQAQLWSGLHRSLFESFDYYGWHHLMGNISGNQDRPRFASLADGSVKGNEDTKLAGWTRDIQNASEKGYTRMLQLMALNMTIPGVPVIYYGDEYAMPGGNDPDNRRMMQFESYTTQQQNLIDNIKKLTALRKSNMALLYGEFKSIDAGKQFFAYERNYFGQKVVVVFSKNGGALSLPTSASQKWIPLFNHAFSQTNNTIDLQLNADDVEIFTLH
ncbi:MAG: alpha-amylase family glycosyl hydrolase [Bacteroidota bacterium]